MSKYDPNFKPKPTYFLAGMKVIVHDGNGKLLIMRRSEKCSRAGGWDFCGGAIDNEDLNIEEAAIRETKEESGLEVVEMKLVFADLHRNNHGKQAILLGYSALAKDKKVKISWEHDFYEWVTKKDALKREMPKFHRDVLKHSDI